MPLSKSLQNRSTWLRFGGRHKKDMAHSHKRRFFHYYKGHVLDRADGFVQFCGQTRQGMLIKIDQSELRHSIRSSCNHGTCPDPQHVFLVWWINAPSVLKGICRSSYNGYWFERSKILERLPRLLGHIRDVLLLTFYG